MWSRPVMRSPFGHPTCTVRLGSTNPHKNALLEAEFRKPLKKGAIEIPENESSLGFYLRLFLVPKPNDDWRPVIDLGLLNDFIQIPNFKMDTPQKIMSSLKKGHWVNNLDLKDAYLQVPIYLRLRKYLRMEFQGTIFQFMPLSFGISMALWLFTRSGAVKELFHRDGLSPF